MCPTVTVAHAYKSCKQHQTFWKSVCPPLIQTHFIVINYLQIGIIRIIVFRNRFVKLLCVLCMYTRQ